MNTNNTFLRFYTMLDGDYIHQVYESVINVINNGIPLRYEGELEGGEMECDGLLYKEDGNGGYVQI